MTQCARCFNMKTEEKKDSKTGKVYVFCGKCGYVFCPRIEEPEVS